MPPAELLAAISEPNATGPAWRPDHDKPAARRAARP
jgi:hypothetical protein